MNQPVEKSDTKKPTEGADQVNVDRMIYLAILIVNFINFVLLIKNDRK